MRVCDSYMMFHFPLSYHNVLKWQIALSRIRGDGVKVALVENNPSKPEGEGADSENQVATPM